MDQIFVYISLPVYPEMTTFVVQIKTPISITVDKFQYDLEYHISLDLKNLAENEKKKFFYYGDVFGSEYLQ